MTKSEWISLAALVVSAAALANSFAQKNIEYVASISADRPRLEVHPTMNVDVKRSPDGASFEVENTAANVGVAPATKIRAYEDLVVTDNIDYAARRTWAECQKGLIHDVAPSVTRGAEAKWDVSFGTIYASYFQNPDRDFTVGNWYFENKLVDATYVVGCVTYEDKEYNHPFEEDYAYQIYVCKPDMPHCGPLGMWSPSGPPSRVDLRPALTH